MLSSYYAIFLSSKVYRIVLRQANMALKPTLNTVSGEVYDLSLCVQC